MNCISNHLLNLPHGKVNHTLVYTSISLVLFLIATLPFYAGGVMTNRDVGVSMLSAAFVGTCCGMISAHQKKKNTNQE